jgi:tetrahydromethanopterin S-methyltransferase subunit F
MKKSVCYVDDDTDELRRFRNTFQDRYILGIGTTLDEALDDLRNKHISKPDLFLLDLYFGPTPKPDERRKMLEADARLTEQEDEVRRLLAGFNQKPDGGFSLAEDAARRCPRVPRVFFSRKAFLEDAMNAQEKGLPLLGKPDPVGGENYDTALKRNAQKIISKIDQIIYQNSFWARQGQRIEGLIAGFISGVLVTIFVSIVTFGWGFLVK